MLFLAGTFINQPILSLQSGSQIATSVGAIIDPNNLKIEALYARDNNKRHQILLTQDIREISADGLIVNDFDVLAEPEQLVRLKKALELNFQLIGKPVQTASKERVGKVSDFAADNMSFFIQKLYVSQSLMKSFSGGALSIDRSQIQEITNRRIVISDLENDSRIRANAPVPA